MTSDAGLSIGQIYSIVNHTDGKGVEGYYAEKKYFDAAKIAKDKQLATIKKGQKDRRHVTKRGNFLQDEQKIHKVVPGPGQYPINQEWPQKSTLKIPYPDKQTYVDEIMKRQKKQKKPAPGQYNVFKSLKDLQSEKKKLAQKKVHVPDRITYLDQIQYESDILPGVGNYNIRNRVHTEGSQLKTKPEDWRKKHEQASKKKPQKSPDMRTYKPQPSDYALFQTLSKAKTSKNLLGKVQRFKTASEGSGLNPAKYNVIQQWKGKQKTKVGRHGYEVLSNKKTFKSVYYH